MAFQLDAQVFTTIKTETLGKNLRFEPKKPQKISLPGVYMAALKRLGIVMYDCDDAQIYRMAFELDAQGDPTLKTATLFGKMRFEPKNVKKVVFSASSGLH